MSSDIQKEWDRLIEAPERKLAKQIEELNQEGLSAIKIASRLNLRVTLVWRYLQTRNPEVLRQTQGVLHRTAKGSTSNVS